MCTSIKKMEDLTTNNLNIILNNLISRFNTLLDCPARFSGGYGGQEIQHFIEYIKSYKRVKCITDEQALEELGYLLSEHAYTWWLRRKSHFSTWSEALTALQNQYAKQRPAYLIYKDILEHSFEEYTTEEGFINDKYELLTELPDPKQSEKNKLDMIFALLPNDIQSKLEYSHISSLVELKEQIIKLKCNQNIIVAKQSNCNIDNTSPCAKSIEEINGHDEAENEGNQCDRMDIPSTVFTVIEKDPIIKVRRTEDLMPQVKQEESGEAILEQQEEFISTENITGNHHTNENTNFQIDIDIMNQINNIIDESEMNCDSVCDNLKVSSVMSVKESPATTIAFLLNGETTIQAEVLKKMHPAVRAIESNQIPRRLRARCTYCRKYNHKSQDCLKRAKHMKLFPDKFLAKPNTSSDDPKEIEEAVASNNNSNNDSVNSISTEPTTCIPPLVSNVPPLITSTNASISQPTMATSVATSFSLNTSLPPVPPTFSHITTMTSTPLTFSHTAALTTKLIAPINGPGSNKQLAAKLRNINGPSPKCHQCGNVGFYKSICPNCSPIYNSNQYK